MQGKEHQSFNRLKGIILSGDFLEICEEQPFWNGADVVVTNEKEKNHEQWLDEQPIVISLQNTEAKRRLLVTPYARELSWLFSEIAQIVTGHLDYISKYDFYGNLADHAQKLIEAREDRTFLLLDTLDNAKKLLNVE